MSEGLKYDKKDLSCVTRRYSQFSRNGFTSLCWFPIHSFIRTMSADSLQYMPALLARYQSRMQCWKSVRGLVTWLIFAALHCYLCTFGYPIWLNCLWTRTCWLFCRQKIWSMDSASIRQLLCYRRNLVEWNKPFFIWSLCVLAFLVIHFQCILF